MSRPIDQRIIRLTLDNSDVVTEGKATKTLVGSLMDAFANLGRGGGFGGLIRDLGEINREFGILDTIATGALLAIGGGFKKLGANILGSFTGPIRQGWAEFDGLLGQQQQIMVNSGRSIEELNKLMGTLQEHANRSTASFAEMVKMTNALAASPWVEWYDLDGFIIGFQTLAYLMASGTDKVRAMNNQFIPMMNGLMAGQEATQAQLAELYNWGLLGMPLLRSMTDQLIDMGKITEETAHEIHMLGAVGGILELQERLGDTALLAYAMRDGFIQVGEEMSHLATTPISFQRLLEQIQNIQLAGWKRSFELIIGNVVQAREVFGMLADIIVPIVSNIHDWRNDALQIWQDMGGREHLFGSFAYYTGEIARDMYVWNEELGKMEFHAAGTVKTLREGSKYFSEYAERSQYVRTSLGAVGNILTALLAPIRAVGNAISGAFGTEGEGLAAIIFILTNAFYRFSQLLMLTVPVFDIMGAALHVVLSVIRETVKFILSFLPSIEVDFGRLYRTIHGWSESIVDFLMGIDVAHAFERMRHYITNLDQLWDRITGLMDINWGRFRRSLRDSDGDLTWLGRQFDSIGLSAQGFLANLADSFGFYGFAENLRGLTNGLEVLRSVWDAVTNFIHERTEFLIQNTLANIAEFFGFLDFADYLRDFGSGFEALTVTVQRVFGRLANYAGNLGAALLALLGVVGSLFGAAGFGLVRGFNWVTSWFTGVGRDASAGASGVETMSNAWSRFTDTISRVSSAIMQVMGPALNNLFGWMRDFMDGITFDRIITFMYALASFQIGSGLKRLPKAISNLAGAFGEVKKKNIFEKLLEPFGKFRKEFTDSVKEITEGIDNLTQGTKFSPPILLQVAAALGVFAAAVFAIGQLDGPQIAKAMGALAGGMAGMFALVQLFKKNPIDGIKMKAVGATMTKFAAAMLVMAGAAKVLGSMDFLSMVQGVAGASALLAAFMVLNSKLKQPELAPATFKGAMASIVQMYFTTKQIKKLAIVAAALGLLPLPTAIQGIASVSVLMAGMVKFVTHMSTMPPVDASIIATMVALTKLLGKTSLMVIALGAVPLNIVIQGTATVAVLGTLMISMVKMLSKIKMVKVPTAALATMKTLTAVLAAMTPMVIVLGAIPQGVAIQGVATVAALSLVMVGLVGLMAIIDKFLISGGSGMVKAAASVAILVGAMNMLVPVIITMGALPFEIVAVGIGVFAASLAVLILAGAGAQKFSVGLLALSAAVLSISISFNTGVIAIAALAVALPALAIAVVAAAATLMGSAAILEQFIILVGQLLVTFIRTTVDTLAGMAFELGVAVGKIVVGVGSGLLTSMDQIMTMIAEAIIFLIVGISDILSNNMRSLVKSVGNMILTAIDEMAIFIWANAPRIAAAAGLIVGALVEALMQAFVDIARLVLPGFLADKLEDAMMSGIRETNYEQSARLLAARCEAMARYGFIEGVEAGIQGATPSLIAASQVAVDEMGRPWYQLDASVYGTAYIEDITTSIAWGTGLISTVAIEAAEAASGPFAGMDMGGIMNGQMGDFMNELLSGSVSLDGLSGDISQILPDHLNAHDFAEIGVHSIEDLAEGIESIRERVSSISGDVARDLVEGFSSGDYIGAGSSAGIDFGDGLSYHQKGIWELGRMLAEAGFDGITDPNFLMAADENMIEFITGMDAYDQRVLNSAMRISDYAYKGLDYIDTFVLGQELGYGYAQGLNCVGGSSQAVDLATRKQADLVARNLRDVDSLNYGVQVMGNYAAGIVQTSGDTNRAVQMIVEGQKQIIQGANFTGEGYDSMVRFANGATANQQFVNRAMSAMTLECVEMLRSLLYMYGDEGRSTMVQMAAGVDGGRELMVRAIKLTNDEGLKEAAKAVPEFKDIAETIAESSAEAVRTGIPGWIDSVRNFFSEGAREARRENRIRNPSEVYIEIGESIADGAGTGVNNGLPGFLGRVRDFFTQGRQTGESVSYVSAGQAAVDTASQGTTGRQSVFRTAVNNVMTNVRTFANGFNSSSIGRNYVDSFSTGTSGRQNTFRTAVNNVLTNVRTVASGFNSRSIGTNYMNEATTAAGGRENHFRTGINRVLTNVRNGLNNFNSRILGTNYVNQMRDGSEAREGHFRGGINAVLTNVRNGLNNFNSRAIGTGYVNNVRSGAEGRESNLRSGMNGIMNRVRGAAGSIAFNSVGTNAMRGVEAGAQGRAGTSNNVFANLGRGLLNSMNRVLGIRSPSREFMQIAVYCMMGLERGLESYNIVKTVERICDTIIRPFEGLVGDVRDKSRSLVDAMSTASRYANQLDSMQLGKSIIDEMIMGVRYRQDYLTNAILEPLMSALVTSRKFGERFIDVGMAIHWGIRDGIYMGIDRTADLLHRLSVGNKLTFMEPLKIFHGSSRAFQDISMAIHHGLRSGMNNGQQATALVFKNMARVLVRTMEQELGINSPSVVFRNIARYCIEGFKQGFSDMDVVGAAERLCEAILSPFEDLADGIKDAIDGAFDDVVLRPKLSLAGGGHVDVHDPRGYGHGDQYNHYEFGDTHVNITVPDGQSAEETMDVFEAKFNKCMIKTIREFRVVR